MDHRPWSSAVKNMKIRLFLLPFALFFQTDLLFSQEKHAPMEVLRYSISPYYLDTPVQRGSAFKIDYIKNFKYWQRVFLYSAFFSHDRGHTAVRYRELSSATDTISHHRYDIGALAGGHLYTDIQSSFYFLSGIGYTKYTYKDTSVRYDNVSYSGLSSYFLAGLSTRFKFLSYSHLHFEMMFRQVFYLGEHVREDVYEAHKINSTRYYFGISKKFNLGKYI